MTLSEIILSLRAYSYLIIITGIVIIGLVEGYKKIKTKIK